MFNPATMYHRPSFPKTFASKFGAIASSDGTGYSPVSCFCLTQFLLLTAHVLNVCTALEAYRSPHLIWQSASSGLPKQPWRHTRDSAHFSSARQPASSTLHLERRHLPVSTVRASMAPAAFGRERESAAAAAKAATPPRSFSPKELRPSSRRSSSSSSRSDGALDEVDVASSEEARTTIAAERRR